MIYLKSKVTTEINWNFVLTHKILHNIVFKNYWCKNKVKNSEAHI